MPDRELKRFLLYAGCTRRTGQLLGYALGIEHGRQMPEERYDYLIRWGSTRRIRYIPEIRTWNRRSRIRRNTDKYNSLGLMDEAGVRVPPYSREWEDLEFPMLGRASNHMQGSDVTLFLQPRDFTFMGTSDYYVQYIPKEREYRVHVVQDQVLGVWEKTARPGVDDYDPVTCVNDGHWTRRDASSVPSDVLDAPEAVAAMELDFGAVDVIVGLDGQVYFLEVNTAPGLTDGGALPLYIDALRELIELE